MAHKNVTIPFTEAEWKVLLADFEDPALAMRIFWQGRAKQSVADQATAARINGATGTDEEIVLAAAIPTAVERAATEDAAREPVPA